MDENLGDVIIHLAAQELANDIVAEQDEEFEKYAADDGPSNDILRLRAKQLIKKHSKRKRWPKIAVAATLTLVIGIGLFSTQVDAFWKSLMGFFFDDYGIHSKVAITDVQCAACLDRIKPDGWTSTVLPKARPHECTMAQSMVK